MSEASTDLKIILIDDDDMLLKAVAQIFELDNLQFEAYSDPQEALKHIDAAQSGPIVTDVRMPAFDGFALFDAVQDIDPEIPVIFITGHADVPMVLNTLRNGAFDFLTKPLDSDRLLASARRALSVRKLVLENRKLRALAERAAGDSALIGDSPAIKRLRDTIYQVAQTDVDVLIEGETGTGKDLVSSLLHAQSARSARVLVTVNCAAMPEDHAALELLGTGSRKGAPVMREYRGQIETAQHGTLVLNEIDGLPLSVQAQLLPVLEKREVVPIGSDRARPVNLRIIATSQLDLGELAESSQFRADLLYRLNTIRLRIPPLRDRSEDIPQLFAHFLTQAADQFAKPIPKLSAPARRRLIDYDWPGNVRELRNFATSVVLGLEAASAKNLSNAMTLPERVERFEGNTIRSALEQTQGDVRSTLEVLGIPRKTFYDKVSRHSIDLKKFRKRS